MIRARQTTAAILTELDQMNLAETGIDSLPARCPPRVLTDDCPLEDWALCPSPLQSRTLSLLESASMAEGPPPAEPEPQSRKLLFFVLLSLTPCLLSSHVLHSIRCASAVPFIKCLTVRFASLVEVGPVGLSRATISSVCVHGVVDVGEVICA
ncbi:unnamed protein product [Dibothriocephalus latus]|uniref:Uncharacterized protein n=1 Tax=Dibothriocephalus latus TaxID=60516 RepID=A0A3P7LV39_DIBLA|nr:unnamed protein product [Dibothriocephalus latus]